MIDRKLIDPAPERLVPRHVAIIMDGNRRWARERGLPSIEGHRAGAAALRQTCRAAAGFGIEILTVFAFSEENKRRDPVEIRLLMDLIRAFALREAKALRADNVRVRTIGRTSELPSATKLAVDALVEATAANDGMLLNLALNYGARGELCDAIKALALDVQSGRLGVAAIDDDSLSDYLYTAGMPDPDLLIRTGGELRVSNFLLYQIAYAELWATPTQWPDFDRKQLEGALSEFAKRQRRFGT